MENPNSPLDQGIVPLPNSTAVLVLGIVSIPVCLCYFTFGIIGITCAIIALVLSNKSTKMYRQNPDGYLLSTYKNLNAGRICAIVGLCLNGICFLIMLFYLIFLGAVLTHLPWNEIMNQQ